MPLHFGLFEVQAQIHRELARIGVTGPAADGLAGSRPITPEQMLAAMAATPDGAGTEALLAELERRLAADADPGTSPTGT